MHVPVRGLRFEPFTFRWLESNDDNKVFNLSERVFFFFTSASRDNSPSTEIVNVWTARWFNYTMQDLEAGQGRPVFTASRSNALAWDCSAGEVDSFLLSLLGKVVVECSRCW